MKNFPHNAKAIAEDSRQKADNHSAGFDKFWDKELEALPKFPSPLGC